MSKPLALPDPPRLAAVAEPLAAGPARAGQVAPVRPTRRSERAVPADFAEALAKEPRAKAFFDKLWPAHREALLTRLCKARRRDTRRMRIEFEIAVLARR